MELEDKDLSLNYRTHCDPRLNYEQSLGECEAERKWSSSSSVTLKWVKDGANDRRCIPHC